jgi:hypothetical protein
MKSPKEEADELINKYLTSRDANQWDDVRDVHAAIRCALIAIDEVLKYSKAHGFIGLTDEYLEIKKEIEKL